MPGIVEILNTVARIDQQDSLIRQAQERIDLQREQNKEAVRQFNALQNLQRDQQVLAERRVDIAEQTASDNLSLQLVKAAQTGRFERANPDKTFSIPSSVPGVEPTEQTLASDNPDAVTFSSGDALAPVPEDERFAKTLATIQNLDPNIPSEDAIQIAQRVFLGSNTTPTSRPAAGRPFSLQNAFIESMVRQEIEQGGDPSSPDFLGQLLQTVSALTQSPQRLPQPTPVSRSGEITNRVQQILGQTVQKIAITTGVSPTNQAIIERLSRGDFQLELKSQGFNDEEIQQALAKAQVGVGKPKESSLLQSILGEGSLEDTIR